MMGEGSNINRVVKTGSMDDVGSRISHLLDLYNLWQEGIDILVRYDKHTPGYEDKKKELEIACRLLNYHRPRRRQIPQHRLRPLRRFLAWRRLRRYHHPEEPVGMNGPAGTARTA